MQPKLEAKALRFHDYFSTDLNFRKTGVIDRKLTSYFVTQERELSYRFRLHQHPVVQQLMQRLLSNGTAGLQAADTEYAEGEISLPYGVDVQLESGVNSPIAGGVRIGLLEGVTATDSDGAQIALAAKDELEIASATEADVFAGTRATLVDPMEQTPHPGVRFALVASRGAIFSADTPIRLTQVAALKRPDGTTVSIPSGTNLVVQAREPFTISAAADVTLLRRRLRPKKDLYAELFAAYEPDAELVQQPHPVKDLDFSSSGAYALYNWELFYHVPLTIAIHLSRNQRCAEAQKWFHYIFDPTDDSDGPVPERFWKVRPFQSTDVRKAEEILVNLATHADPDLRRDTLNSIEAWKDAPFRPHVIARYRQQSYMYKAVMAYLDNLIAWGDSLFRQDTGEAIDEALMLYVLAANILGPRPLPVPKKGTVRARNYASLRQDLKQFGVVMRDMEADIPFDLMPFPASGSGDEQRLSAVRSLGKSLYFCVPRNDKLLGYWDTVADRLFKIRNSLNLQGVFRQLALFEPPIDPALLARAAASGLDIGAVVSGLNQPLPLVRFTFLIQKAAEIAQELKSLGSGLLSAMEKEDGEAMAILRARHERAVMQRVEQVKYAQWQESIKAREGLLKSLDLALQRYTYYERQLGKKEEDIRNAIPELKELSSEERERLESMKFSIQEPVVAPRPLEIDIAEDLNASGGKIVSSHEARELAASHSARDWQVRASTTATIASLSHYVPKIGADVKPLGVGMHLEFGGDHVGPAFSAIAEHQRNLAAQDTYDATHASKLAGFQRRQLDWTFQSNLAAGEITQIFKQLRAAQIREAVAEKEWHNQQQQIRNAQEIEFFLTGEKDQEWSQKIDPTQKKSIDRATYTWIRREAKALCAQCFNHGFDIAKKAERALQRELGNPQLGYLQFGYLAGKEGLLAGEKLYLDIKRMEMAFHELNQREYELTRHVSLLQLDPVALLQLRTTGRCTVRLPEQLFDMDTPGHYFRRIKAVAVSIPCVTGPYASVNCTLTLLKSSIRKSAVLRDEGYERAQEGEDDRFDDHYGSLQSIVTSSAQNDSGLFETNLRDERYLPFENSGVIGEWQLELPANPGRGEPCQFDYGTISDVILHLRYAAREGGGLLKKQALAALSKAIDQANALGSVRFFSVRHDFPGEWAVFQRQAADGDQPLELSVTVRPEHYPFWSIDPSKKLKTREIRLWAKGGGADLTVLDARRAGVKDEIARDAALGLTGGALVNVAPFSTDEPLGELKMRLRMEKKPDDLWLAIQWGRQEG